MRSSVLAAFASKHSRAVSAVGFGFAFFGLALLFQALVFQSREAGKSNVVGSGTLADALAKKPNFVVF